MARRTLRTPSDVDRHDPAIHLNESSDLSRVTVITAQEVISENDDTMDENDSFGGGPVLVLYILALCAIYIM
jgi:hypothetical protein